MAVRNEVLWQLFMDGPVWDGDLISKADRDECSAKGWVFQYRGWNFVTPLGVAQCLALGYDREKEKSRRVKVA